MAFDKCPKYLNRFRKPLKSMQVLSSSRHLPDPPPPYEVRCAVPMAKVPTSEQGLVKSEPTKPKRQRTRRSQGLGQDETVTISVRKKLKKTKMSLGHALKPWRHPLG